MSIFRIVALSLLCVLLLLVVQNGCVIGDAGPCQSQEDCERFNPPLLCARGWCVPQYIYDKVKAADAKKDAGQEGMTETVPERDRAVAEVLQEQSKEQKSCQDQCKAAEVADCYPAATQGCDEKSKKCEGVCSLGQKQCTIGADGCLVWGQCLGAGLPSSEACDGKDNDCNGKIDDNSNCSCVPGATQDCGSDEGECQKGKQSCDQKGQWGECIGEKKPSVEVCDGKDNDCNGKIDEVLPRACYTGAKGTEGKGPCIGGIERCESGKWGKCLGERVPEKEKCDGVDNDCTGMVDEGCTCKLGDKQVCGSFDKGICKKGLQYCNAQGTWDACLGEVKPKSETCDGTDEDCDGKVDGLTRPCYSGPVGTAGKGKCKQGTETCTAGKWGSCSGEVKPDAKEQCKNKIDDNCDGKVDEDCQWAAVVLPGGVSGSHIHGKGHVAADAAGNVYIAGRFSGSAKFGSITLNAIGRDNGFVAKLDKSGKFLWAKLLSKATAGAANKIEVRDIAATASGDVLIVGKVHGSVKVAGQSYQRTGSEGAFVGKLSTTGSVTWFKVFGGGQTGTSTSRCTTTAEAVALDSTGNIYVAGHTSVDLVVNSAQVVITDYCGNVTEPYALVFDSTGKGTKALHAGGNGVRSSVRKMKVDTGGNVWLCGEVVSGSLKLGSTNVTTSSSKKTAFLVKFGSNGTVSWSGHWKNGKSDILCSGLAVQGVFVSVSLLYFGPLSVASKAANRGTQGPAILLFDTNGKHRWSEVIDASGDLTSHEVAFAKSGAVFAVGRFMDNVTFGTKTLNVGDEETYVVSLSGQSGAVLSIAASNASVNGGTSVGFDIHFDSEGSNYVLGDFSVEMDIGGLNVKIGSLTALYVIKNPL